MIEIQHLTKTFTTAGGVTEALKDVSLTIPDGEIYGIIGMSGAGKSTLVRSINMLERPTEGKIIIDGRDMAALTERELQVARMIVDRRTNAEIAGTLFLSPKTVEHHLTSILRKRGLGSRAAVAAEFAGRQAT